MKLFFASMLCASFTLSCINGSAQNNPIKDITIASPNAAALGKYGDIPVGFHTGVPQTNIPIYTVEEGSLKFPITLNYHASGMKVLESASWVGTGWSLSAGGMITRSVSSAPDDRGFGSVSNVQNGHFSNYGYNNYYWVNNQGNGCPPATADGKMIDASQVVNGIADYEPDMFTFNFLNYAGKFYFRDDRTPALVPEQDLKIQSITQTTADNIYGFVVTTPDGTKYYFGKNPLADGNPDAFEVTSPYSTEAGIVNGTCISSWFLNRVVSSDGKFSISLIYAPEQYAQYTISAFPLLGSEPETTKEYKVLKNNINGVRLSQIVCSNGTITLVPGALREDLMGYNTSTISQTTNTDAKTLSAIEINNSQGFCKSYSFQYDYFIDNSTPLPDGIASVLGAVTVDQKRLRLKQVQEKLCDGSVVLPPYSFIYLAPNQNPDFAPRCLTFAQDHWGFYNGKVGNQKLMPTYSINNFTIYKGADRETSWPESSYGTLSQVKYPTGGTSSFEYESNDVWLNYPYYNEQSQLNTAIGPGVGNPNNTSFTINCTGNQYKLTMDFHTSSSTTTGQATLASLIVNRTNTHAETVIQPPAGQQTFYLSQSNMTGIDYASVVVFEEIPVFFQGNKVVGGLRVKKIVNSDGATAIANTTNYSYLVNGQSSGILYGRPIYVELPRSETFKTIGAPTSANTCSTNGCYFCDQGYIKSAASVRPLSTTQGNHIGYNEVKVSQPGNGYSVYRYYGSNIWDIDQRDVAIRNVNFACDASAPDYPHIPPPTEFKRGELKYKGDFSENGQVIKEATYYPVYIENPIRTPAIAYVINGFANGKTRYELSTAKKTQLTVVSNMYSNQGGVLTTVDSSFFSSPNHTMLTRHVMINSRGENVESRYKYAFDFLPLSVDTLSDCYAQYQAAVTAAQNAYNYQLAACINTTSCNCRYTAFNQYERDLSLARIVYVNCRRRKFVDNGNTFQTNHDASKAGADGELKPVLEMQDRYQNALIETTVWKRGLLAKASYSKYDFSGVNVYLTQTYNLPLSKLENSYSSAAVFGNTLLKDSRFSLESSASYANGNLSDLALKNAITTSYLWDYQNNLVVAQSLNGQSVSIAYTSFEADGSGGWTGINPTNIHSGRGATGKKYYENPSGFSLSRTGLFPSLVYVVSYWSKNGAYTINGSSKVTAYVYANEWTYYEQVLEGVPGGTVTVSGSGAIDELRLFPKGAMMTTYTYEPLIGMTSQTDPNGRTTTYTYDGLGRLSLVRDKDNNILKKYCYNYAGQSESCPIESTAANWQPTGDNRCKTDINGHFTGYQQVEEQDNNQASPTYNTKRWVDNGYKPSECLLPDIIACDTSHNDRRWINGTCELGVYGVLGYYNDGHTSCRTDFGFHYTDEHTKYDHTQTDSCDTQSCDGSSCQGSDKRCVEGLGCVAGTLCVIGQYYNGTDLMCDYGYQFYNADKSIAETRYYTTIICQSGAAPCKLQ